MSEPMHLLLLAGAGEAREISAALVDESHLRVMASLHYPDRNAEPLVVPTRVGGFGGADGFMRYLRSENIGAVLDVTHSFAADISRRSARICADLGLPYAQLLRPEWCAGVQDNWFDVADEAGAAAVIPPGARVFTTTGRATLAGFKTMRAAHLYVRQLSDAATKVNIKNASYIVGDAPFSTEEEVALFQDLKIDWLVTRNAGGDAGRTKLDAARELGLPVAMIRRPPKTDGPKLQSAQEALDWVAAL